MGDKTNLDLGAIEKHIRGTTKEMEDYLMSYRTTGGGKTRLPCLMRPITEYRLRQQYKWLVARKEAPVKKNAACNATRYLGV